MKRIHILSSLVISVTLMVMLTIPISANAQLNVTLGSQHPGWTPDSIVRNIFLGTGVDIDSVRFNGSLTSISCGGIGNFTTGSTPTGIGISSGLILSACDANYIAGTASASATHSCTTVTDAALSNISTVPLQNLSVLEFDFIPKSDSIRFKYVFASEEYANYTCSNYNDVFAFFLTGPRPSTTGEGGMYTNFNIATIPDTDLPVKINNVNGGVATFSPPVSDCNLNFSQYFNNNFNHTLIAHMTGATTVLTAEAKVIACQRYHLKLAIANASDGALPSVVFLEANSLSTNAISFDFVNAANPTAVTDLYEGCEVSLRLSRPTAKYEPTLVHVDYSGEATNGVDFTQINQNISFAGGETEINFNISAISDGITEGSESAKFVFSPQDGCPSSDSIEFRVIDTDPISVEIVHDSLTSQSFNVTLNANIIGGMPNRTVVWRKLGDPAWNRTGESISVPTAPDARYTVEVEDGCVNIANDTALIGRRTDFTNVLRAPYGSNSLPILRIADTIICAQDTLRLYAHGADSCAWYTSLNSVPFASHDTMMTFTPTERATYYVRSFLWWNNQWWEDLDSVFVEVVPLPNMTVTADLERICKGSSVTLTASGVDSCSWDNRQTFVTDHVHTFRPDTTTVYHIFGKTRNAGCPGRDSITIIVDTMPVIYVSDPTGVCGGEMAELDVRTVAESFTWSANPPDQLLGGQEHNSHIYVNPAVTTTYTVAATTGVCYTTSSTSVAVEPMPIAIGDVNPKTVSLGNLECTFIDLSQNSTTRLWELPYNETSTDERVTYMVPQDVDSVSVRLWAYNPYQCFDTVTVTVFVDHTTLWTPNAFTPEESTNRTFDVKVNDVQRYHILIYDRRGQLVFESYDPENPWDGTSQNGKKCPQGVYTFLISLHKITHPYEQVVKQGTVLLIR